MPPAKRARGSPFFRGSCWRQPAWSSPRRRTAGAIGEEILATLLEPTVTAVSDNLRPFVRRAQAIALLKQHAGADATLLADPKLKFWIPASEEVAARSAAGAVRQVWLAHEDHLLHLAGPHNDYLCFRYPLTGEFEFQVEAQNGGPPHTFGGLAFGGLAYGVAGNADELRVWDLALGRTLTRPMPFVRKERWPTYQRLTLRSSRGGSQLLVNGHPVWKDTSLSSTSPWLALRSYAQYVPAFRNARLSGSPVIPREVRLAEGSGLRGWLAQFYPSRVPEEGEPAGEYAAFDWQMRDGVIHGAHRQEPFPAAVQSSLAYFRPLENDESISYEFLYEPGRYEVHPAAGRLALLIEPGGVRVHWMTGGEMEWTGLAENNATIEPLNRRGPRPLPLKAGQWNRVTMSLANNTLGLTLNDLEIYQRKMEVQPSWRFSFYHDRSRSAAQVRNVVLRGNWPERLTEQDRANLAAPREKTKVGPDTATRRWLGQIFDDRHVSDSALVVHRRAATLPPPERFAALASYVLPGPDHDTLRLSLDFTPTNPAPWLGETMQRLEQSAANSYRRPWTL